MSLAAASLAFRSIIEGAFSARHLFRADAPRCRASTPRIESLPARLPAF